MCFYYLITLSMTFRDIQSLQYPGTAVSMLPDATTEFAPKHQRGFIKT